MLTQQSRELFCVNIDTTVKVIILYQYWHNSQRNNFVWMLTRQRNHFVWILTQQSKEFLVWILTQQSKEFTVWILRQQSKKFSMHVELFAHCYIFMSARVFASVPIEQISLCVMNKALLNWSKSKISPYFWPHYNCIYSFKSSVFTLDEFNGTIRT